MNIEIVGDFEVEAPGNGLEGGRAINLGLGEPDTTTIVFQSADADLYNLTFHFEGFDTDELFSFGARAPDTHASLSLNGSTLTTATDAFDGSFTFSEFPANTEPRFTFTHNGSGIRITGITFDASESTFSDEVYAYAANTGWINLAPNVNTVWLSTSLTCRDTLTMPMRAG